MLGPRSLRRLVLLGGSLLLRAPLFAAAECDGIDPVLAGSSFVLVRSLSAGGRLESGAAVTGCARTRDARIVWRLEGRDGRKLAEGTAAGGGEAGAAPFSFPVAFEVELAERGTLLLFEKPPGAAAGETLVAAMPLVVAPTAPLALFARYLGTLPCADCGGVATELQLFGTLEREPRPFRLVETSLATKEGDRRVERAGLWSYGIGTSQLPSAIVISIAPEGGDRRQFLVDGRDLFELDRDGRRIEPADRHRLVRQP